MDMALGQVVKPWRGLGQRMDAVAELHGRIAHRFARSEVRERARRRLVGLLDQVERRNGWQLAEAVGGSGPRGEQLRARQLVGVSPGAGPAARLRQALSASGMAADQASWQESF
jgi:hypothetical protein